eukprot:m.136075 g.136075  ORF g.136075 m.136075 type:complete len:757 (-) comp15863_c0_seq2:387-2657(-)
MASIQEEAQRIASLLGDAGFADVLTTIIKMKPQELGRFKTVKSCEQAEDLIKTLAIKYVPDEPRRQPSQSQNHSDAPSSPVNVIRPPALDELFKRDPYLTPYKGHIITRYDQYAKLLGEIEQHEGGLSKFSLGYQHFGFNVCDDGIVYREWAPGAAAVSLTGEFCDWDRDRYPCTKNEFGVWSVVIPKREDGSLPIPEGSIVKTCVTTASGERIDRIPAWITRAIQPKDQLNFEGVYETKTPYDWRNPRPQRPKSLRIYEAHVGIASEEYGVASYDNFTDNVLPRIVNAGYNAIQLMAIMEHAYYGSFGYQVTNFFAVSSRYGESKGLKRLIDKAHEYNLVVLLDVVHSHASKNALDGINMFDGTDSCYFHGGPRGFHDLWDSRLFNYSSWEVLRFLLSNLRWYLEEYCFDGFRFDGVTSMLYYHHGLAKVFGSYDDYFGDAVDNEAVVYLMLANRMIHEVVPSAITIAEEVSGFPGMCRPIEEGGVGFDYKLAMAIPDMWIKLLKEERDEDWDICHIVHTLENRRYGEPCIAYAESHDQALVGDKTIAFWLMDKEMYTHMSTLSDPSPIVDRGLALHKMIRFLTHALGGEGYLNFIGNEFGHPEWLDFPRAGNQESYHHARRQWHLADDNLLKYKYLLAWDTEMQTLEEKYGWLHAQPGYVTCKHQDDKVVVFERAGLVFAFNFHTSKSFSDYRVGVEQAGEYRVLTCTDNEEFGGHSRVDMQARHFTQARPWHDRHHSMLVYLPCRAAVVYARC